MSLVRELGSRRGEVVDALPRARCVHGGAERLAHLESRPDELRPLVARADVVRRPRNPPELSSRAHQRAVPPWKPDGDRRDANVGGESLEASPIWRLRLRWLLDDRVDPPTGTDERRREAFPPRRTDFGPGRIRRREEENPARRLTEIRRAVSRQPSSPVTRVKIR